MRSLRLSLAVTVIVLLVGGAVAVGQSPSPLDPMRPGTAKIEFDVVAFVSAGDSQRGWTGFAMGSMPSFSPAR